jgi:hypothetical protein
VVGDLAKIVEENKNGEGVNGYQIPASALIWKAGDGQKAFHDPISVPRLPEGGGRTNPFFVEFYQGVASKLLGLEAHEQPPRCRAPRVKNAIALPQRRFAHLVLFTNTELSVDIAELNAQSTCATYRPPRKWCPAVARRRRPTSPGVHLHHRHSHDQYYFRRLTDIAGVVVRRLDLANEDRRACTCMPCGWPRGADLAKHQRTVDLPHDPSLNR